MLQANSTDLNTRNYMHNVIKTSQFQ